MVLDCLRYWASEYHIDCFRFDLAAILGRDPGDGEETTPRAVWHLSLDAAQER